MTKQTQIKRWYYRSYSSYRAPRAIVNRKYIHTAKQSKLTTYWKGPGMETKQCLTPLGWEARVEELILLLNDALQNTLQAIEQTHPEGPVGHELLGVLRGRADVINSVTEFLDGNTLTMTMLAGSDAIQRRWRQNIVHEQS